MERVGLHKTIWTWQRWLVVGVGAMTVILCSNASPVGEAEDQPVDRGGLRPPAGRNVDFKTDVHPKKLHWAFRPIVRPRLPPVRNSTWVRNPIDAFVLARLEARSISPSGEADRPR